jgi:hypothetical protein
MNTTISISSYELARLAVVAYGLETQCLVDWGLRRIVGGYVRVDVDLTGWEEDAMIYFTVNSGIQSDVQNSYDVTEMELHRSDFNKFVGGEIKLSEVVNLIK